MRKHNNEHCKESQKVRNCKTILAAIPSKLLELLISESERSSLISISWKSLYFIALQTDCKSFLLSVLHLQRNTSYIYSLLCCKKHFWICFILRPFLKLPGVIHSKCLRNWAGRHFLFCGNFLIKGSHDYKALTQLHVLCGTKLIFFSILKQLADNY